MVDCYYNFVVQKKQITSIAWHTNLNHKLAAWGGFSET